MDDVIDVRIPPMGVFTEVTVLGWLRAVGDEVKVGDPLCEVESEKVNTEVVSPAAGIILDICAETGQIVATGHLIARIRTLLTSTHDS